MTRPRACKNCGGPMPADTRRTVCSQACVAALGGHARGKPEPAAGDVDAMLEAAVQRECAPPWVRHPEPWDNVVVRRGVRA